MAELEPHHLEEAFRICADVYGFIKSNHDIELKRNAKVVVICGQSDLAQYLQKPKVPAAVKQALRNGISIMTADRPFEQSVEFDNNGVASHWHMAYIPDDRVVTAVEGTLADRASFIEETSHAFFSCDQKERHDAVPHRVFLELIGALDKVNYQMLRNPYVDNPGVNKSIKDQAFAGFNERTLYSREPHYYFAHKWAKYMHTVLMELRSISREVASRLFHDFYRATDGEKLHMIMRRIPIICTQAGIEIPSELRGFTHPREADICAQIVREVGDPRVRMS